MKATKHGFAAFSECSLQSWTLWLKQLPGPDSVPPEAQCSFSFDSPRSLLSWPTGSADPTPDSPSQGPTSEALVKVLVCKTVLFCQLEVFSQLLSGHLKLILKHLDLLVLHH